jgi:DNA-binding cell septation regulator SpoVG
MQIDIDVKKIEKEGSSLVGFANVTFAQKLRVDGIKLMKRKDGQLFLSMPSFKTNQKDENGKDIYKDICFPRVKEFKDDLTEAVLECYLGIGGEKSGQMTFGEPSGDLMQVNASVTPIRKEDSKIIGLASITLNNAFRINDIVIRQDAKGKPFVSMPSYRTGKQDANGKDLYKDICYSVKRDFTKTLNGMILDKYAAVRETELEKKVPGIQKDIRVDEKTEPSMAVR